jgi:hypothetical protein
MSGSPARRGAQDVDPVRRFAEVWSEPEFVQPLAAQIGWTHHELPLLVGEQEFFVDLRFYHHTLWRFVVIELKMGRFQPEQGQLLSERHRPAAAGR